MINSKLPLLGKVYDYFDNGVVSDGRHYQVVIDEQRKLNELPKDIREQIKEEQETCKWLYAPTTDYVFKAHLLIDSEITLWFIRDKKGGWFSIGFRGGKLDVDGKIIKQTKEEFKMTDNDYKMCWVLNTLMLNSGATVEPKSKEEIDLGIIAKGNKNTFDSMCEHFKKEPMEMFLDLCEFAHSDYAKNHFKKLKILD